MFHIGQKVECVDDSPCQVWGILPLARGAIYTICSITSGAFWRNGETAWGAILFLEEVKSPHRKGGFGHLRFRPIVERKTDISIFKKMLEPNTHVIAGEDAWDRRITPAMQVSWLDRQEAKMRLELSRMWKSRD